MNSASTYSRADEQFPVGPVGFASLGGTFPSADKKDLFARQRAIAAIGRRALRLQDPAVLMEDAAALLSEVLATPLSGWAELLPDEATLSIRLYICGPDGRPGETVTHQCPLAREASVAGFVMHTGEPLLASDLGRETRFHDSFLGEHQLRSVAAAPLTTADRSFGMLAAYSPQPDYFDEQDLLLVENLSQLVSATLARSRAEALLAAERSLSTGLLETLEAMVLMLDADLRIRHINPAGERISGFKLEEIHQQPIWNVLAAPEESDVLRGRLEQLLSGKAAAWESPLLTKRGECRYVAWSARTLSDHRGMPSGVIATGIDVTDQRQAERRAQRAEAAAEEARVALWAAIHRKSNAAEPLVSALHVERRKRPRRAYPYFQLVAFCTGDGLPDKSAFKEVRCNDIAAGGFSFFSPTPPPSETLVVALGAPPKLIYLVAQVAHVTRTQHNGEKTYLIGCNYIGRARW
jgi:PAS domain S-box-containing protein